MPYTPPSVSPSGLHSVSSVRSSSEYAGLATGHKSNPAPTPRKPSLSQQHTHHHQRPPSHHRRSTGPNSPPRNPIPVAAFAADRASPRRPSPARPARSGTSSSSDEDELPPIDVLPSPRHERHLPNLKELRDAIRELPQHKAPSPPGSPDHELRYTQNMSKDNLLAINTASRVHYDSVTSDGEHSSSTSTPPDDDADFPPMVRKKSGEIVKPSLKNAHLRRRPLSLPSTPVYPKVVHFDVQLEHVRHFLHSEKPLAVSADTSPTGKSGSVSEFPFETGAQEMQYQIELPNFPPGEASLADAPVRVESVYLSSNAPHLVGKVLVKNIAFGKWVTVRFTFDHWQTVSEVAASYEISTQDKTFDRFTFNIKLVDFTNLEDRRMLFCVRYNVCDQEFWDNNHGANYQVEFRKRPNHLLRRSTHPPEINLSRTRDDSAISDDFDIEISPETFAKKLAQQITSPRSALLANLGESPSFTKKGSLAISSAVSLDSLVAGTPQKRPTGKAFANRYDFGASLTAAIANANATMSAEKRSPHKKSSPKMADQDAYFAPLPMLFHQSSVVQSPTVQSPTRDKEDLLVNNIKKSQLSGLQQPHHFRSRSYPIGSPAQNSSWQGEDTREVYTLDESIDKPPMDSMSYLDFINNYCFFESGKSEVPHYIPTLEPLKPLAQPVQQPTSQPSSPAPRQFPSIRATIRSPPPSPRKSSPVRTREDAGGKLSSYFEHRDSSDSNRSSSESSTTSTPRTRSPILNRSPDHSREHSRDSSPPMRFHHHSSPFGLDYSGTSTAIAG